MNKIIIFLAYITQTITLSAQPVDGPAYINEEAFTQPFLHCVPDEKYFAQYAVEAHSGLLNLIEPIKCKLHIPTGLNKIWQDAENSNLHLKGEYDYSKDLTVGIRFNFYVGGVLVSTAFENLNKPEKDNSSFTFYFNLDPLDFKQGKGNINIAYIEFIKKIKKKGSQLVIEAALSSKNSNHKNYVRIACGSFYFQFDDIKYREWNKSARDYNIQLKKLADSTMKSLFGEIGFAKNFTMSCLQNPCDKGYQYAYTLVSNNPCASEPQDSCKEAIVTYDFVKKEVPLTIKMLISIKENGTFVIIENNQYGKNEIPLEKQNLLSITEIQKIINKKFPKDGIEILPIGNALGYSNVRVKQPEYKEEGNKLNRDPGYRLIKETKAGRNWENGFIYIARSTNPKMQKSVYHFDAVTGKLLWITEIYNVTSKKH
jgi:hypothetical protein